MALLAGALGDDGRLFSAVKELGYAGLVVEATGGGHMASATVEPLTELAREMPVVLASRAGSGDSADPDAQEVFAGYAAKTKVRAHVEGLASMQKDLSWSSILCGHFFDRNLRNGLLHFNLKERTADIFDGGESRWSASTLARIGEATAKVLLVPEVTRNRMLYIQSFCVSQRDILQSLERATSQSWQCTILNSGEYLKNQQDASARGDHAAIEDTVLLHGMANSNWERHPGFANRLLGLEDEDLDTVVKNVLRELD